MAIDSIYQDIPIPGDRTAEVDGLARGIELQWLEYAADDLIQSSIVFLDAANQPIGAGSTSPYFTTGSAWDARSHYADMPAGTRKVRFVINMSHDANVTKGTYFTSVSARLVGRWQPQLPVKLLSSVDGPLPGTGDTVAYSYDILGNLTQVTDELGHVTQVLAVNSRNQPLSIRDENGIDTGLAYDVRGRLTSVTVNPGASQAVTSLEYDPAGQITKVTAPDGSFLQYAWNNARRLTSVLNNTSEKIEYTYNANGDVTATTIRSAGNAIVMQQSALFDELGRLMRSIGASTQTTIYGYDRTDKLTTVTDPRSNLYAYAYDALSRLIRETDQENAQVNYGLDAQDKLATYTDPRAIVTSYVRNGFGEAIQETSPDSGVTIYVRNELGDVTQMTDARGVVTNYTYDNAGRMLTKTYPAATAENVAYSYDSTASGNKGVGRLTGIQDQSGSTNWVYDARGNIVAESSAIEAKSYTTAYDYDAADHITKITYPSGRIVTIARNTLGQVSGIVTQKDALAAIETVVTNVGYRPMSELVSGLSYGNGLALATTHDLDYRLSSLRVSDGAIDIVSLAYSYGDGINLTAINDNTTPANTASLGYSPANRLATAAGPWGNASYTYDAVGNRLSETVGASARLFDYPANSNRIATETLDGNLVRSFTHDAAGDLTSGLPMGNAYAVQYNQRNRPSGLTLNGTPVASYLFNAREQMASRTLQAPLSPTGTTHYLYDLAGYLIAEATGADAASAVIVREYVWLNDTPVMVVDDVNTALPVSLFVHTDHLLRPIRMTDGARATVWQATWSPFGTAHAITGTATQNLRFPGQYFLIEQGLAYNWHRFYDASTGRYTQADPLGFPDGPSRYAYAISSPLMYVDEFGAQARSSRGGSRYGMYGPTPMQQFYQYQYTYLRNQVWRYDPNYKELSSSDFRPNLRDIRRLEDYLRFLENGPQPVGGVYGLMAGGQCRYIGKTQNYLQRQEEWSYARPGLDFKTLFRTNDPLQRSGMEQRYFDAYSPSLNVRNPVGPRNPNIREILDAIRGLRVGRLPE